jgi:hypothetical protein
LKGAELVDTPSQILSLNRKQSDIISTKNDQEKNKISSSHRRFQTYDMSSVKNVQKKIRKISPFRPRNADMQSFLEDNYFHKQQSEIL